MGELKDPFTPDSVPSKCLSQEKTRTLRTKLPCKPWQCAKHCAKLQMSASEFGVVISILKLWKQVTEIKKHTDGSRRQGDRAHTRLSWEYGKI